MYLLTLVLLRMVATVFCIAFRVSEKLPKTVESCRLKTDTIRSSRPELGCVILCKNTPSCLLSCAKDDGECRLYLANVSPNWAGVADGNDLTNNAVCYSTWAERSDLTPSSKASTTITLKTGTSVEDVTGGYSCSKEPSLVYILHTDTNEDYPWVLIDLTKYYWVKKVIVQARGDIGDGYSNNFGYIEVRVGRNDDPASFSNNSLLMYMDRESVYGEIITFEGKRALYGRYVSIQRVQQSSYLAFYQVKIIPQL